MAYLCSYVPRPDDAHATYERSPLGETRIWTRGFSCTREELTTELETACRAKRGTLFFDYIAPESVDVWRDHYKQNGARLFINREGFE